MPLPRRERLALVAVLAAAGFVFLPGVHWGLPSRADDAYLFGPGSPAWSGRQVLDAAGPRAPDPARAADADADPLARGARAVVLNDTPARRAQVLRRFRLFSSQPDEMLTFMALAGMPANRYDPRMYQYGGLWFYPLGGMLQVTSKAGLVQLSGDPAYYLDHPEQFARFYIIARLYSAFWGLVGVWAVFLLVRRIAPGSLAVPVTAALCFALMPVVVNAAHEAKPHLAGAVLVLLAVLAALRFVETGLRRHALLCGALCGASTGMVLSTAVAFAVLPAMALLRRDDWRRRMTLVLLAGGLGLLVYAVTNPYVPINLVRNPAVLRANLGGLAQAQAIVGGTAPGSRGGTAVRLISEGTSPPLAILGTAAGFFLLWKALRARTRPLPGRRELALLLGLPALAVLIQFVALAKGKQGEFGRFAILPDVGLMLAAVAVPATWGGERRRAVAGGVLVLATALFGLSYVAGFAQDAGALRPSSSRQRAAERLAALAADGRTLAVYAEPAPYSLPPVNLLRWKLLLLPVPGMIPTDDPPDVIVYPVDVPAKPGKVSGTRYVRFVETGRLPWFANRISWADKPFELLVREDHAAPTAGHP